MLVYSILINREREFEYKRIENGKVVNEYKTTLNVGDIIAESKYEISIPSKINNKTKEKMSRIVLCGRGFGISSNGMDNIETGLGKPIEYFMEPFYNSVKLKNQFFGNKKDVDVYIKRDRVPQCKEYINTYKLIVGHIISKNSFTVLDKSMILEPGHICTYTWVPLIVDNDLDKLKRIQKYYKTNTIKFLFYCYCSNAMTALTKKLMEHIPLQDFSSSSDIDWSKSIADIDQQLYQKYNLTEEEIAYIEKTIKPMT